MVISILFINSSDINRVLRATWKSSISIEYFRSPKQSLSAESKSFDSMVFKLGHYFLCNASRRPLSASVVQEVGVCQGSSFQTLLTAVHSPPFTRSRCLMGLSMTSRHGSSKAILAPNCMSPMHGERWSWRNSVMFSVYFIRFHQTSSLHILINSL